jgi:ubiquinone biosynthesis accessory factor UbiK
MDPSQFLKDLSERLSNILPPALQTMKKDCEKNIHSTLVSAFNKLDLITREEFDAQAKVLARSRQKIEALESKIQSLEKLIQDSAK